LDDVVKDESLAITAFLPTLFGGYAMALLTFPIFYIVFYYFIEGARKAKNTVGIVGEKVHDITHRKKEKRDDK